MSKNKNNLPIKIIPFKRERATKIISLSIIGVIFLIIIALLFVSSGTFLAGWFGVVSFVILMLVFISAPKYVSIFPDKIVIQGMVESTVIHTDSITDIKDIGDIKLRQYIPLYGSLGIMGYFGIWLDTHGFRVIRMSCTTKKGCIEINTKEGRNYIISIPMTEELLEIKERIESEKGNG